MKKILAVAAASLALVSCGPSTTSVAQPPSTTQSTAPEIARQATIRLRMGAGEVDARVWLPATQAGVPSLPGPGKGAGLLFFSGVDGGFVEPVDGIYERMAVHFAKTRKE